MQARSMRNNLIFKGIPEAPLGTREDCEGVVKDFMQYKLGIEHNVSFVRVHRLGNDKRKQQRDTTVNAAQSANVAGAASNDNHSAPYPRPIVAMFERYKDREHVRQRATSGALMNTGYYIDEHFPKEIEDRRKPLYTVRREAKYAGDDCTLVVDRLYINNEQYSLGQPVRSSKSAVLRNAHDPVLMKQQRAARWKGANKTGQNYTLSRTPLQEAHIQSQSSSRKVQTSVSAPAI